jgi:ATP-dependent helicase/nuclease subunit B
MQQDLAQRIEAGCVVVTPNRRLAAHLKREFDSRELASGRRVWPTALVLPYGAFLERIYSELTCFTVGATLLSLQQEMVLWEQSVVTSIQGGALLNAAAAARAARDAWQLQHSHRINVAKYGPGLDEDARAYAQWAEVFKVLCDRNQWLDLSRLPDAIAVALERGGVLAPRALVAYAFLELDKQQRTLFDALTRHGWTVTELAPNSRPRSGVRMQFADAGRELLSVGTHVRTILAADPTSRIGVIVPDLVRRRPDVVRIFDDVLEPGRVVSFSRERSRPYNISLGLPLNSYPLVHSGLLVLTLARGELALEDMGSLLRSPHIAGAQHELASRALLDARLRERHQPKVSVGALRNALRSEGVSGPAASPVLADRLERWVTKAREGVRKRQPPSQWSATFLEMLSGLGWPGERTLDSEEFQTFEKFREAVSGLSALDLVTGRMSFDAAVAALRRACGDTLFQPESPEVPVQVLGVLEANGLEFDHLFVTGLTDELWPEPPRPNPFLPVALQVAANVPHASSEWTLAFARRVTRQWLAAAPDVRCSHPSRDGDRDLNASPLLRDLAERKPDAVTTALYGQVIFDGRSIEELVDFAAPALPAGIEAPRGTDFFKNQAACPFRSFAAHRLGAEPLEIACPGLDPRDRGDLVHRAAQNVWDELKSQACLIDKSEEALRELVKRGVVSAVDAMRKRRPDVMSDAYSALERERLTGLMMRLLALEKQRAPFELLAREGPQVVTVAGVKVRTRPDRVDRLLVGGQIVLDYKTGRTNVGDWHDERPEEPQLPLYAVSVQGQVAGVAFVQLRAEELAFKGLTRSDGVLPAVQGADEWRGVRKHPAWVELFEDWRKMLENLAREYLNGRAEVAPKLYPKTCRHCHFGGLCRVEELRDRGLISEAEMPPDRKQAISSHLLEERERTVRAQHG